MADELKQEEKKVDAGKVVSAIFKVLLGVVFLVLGVLALWAWRKDFLVMLKGCIGPFLILAAVITFAIAKE